MYGNQCIVFSGNCLWGGLTKTGSGHKGGCIGSCNDFYQTRDGAIGNFFWSNNIGLFSFASCLESKGIDCIKIEGRLRKSNEIINIVSKFRSALDGESIDNDYDFDGYLAGKLPPHNQLHFLNPQNTFRIFESIAYTGNDVVVKEIQEENRLSLGDGTGSGKYVCTIFGKSLKRNETNIQLRFKFVFIDHTLKLKPLNAYKKMARVFLMVRFPEIL